MMRFKGVMPALVTPLNEDQTINTGVLTDLIEHLLAQGANGFYVGGATGEGISLKADDRRVLAETTVAATAGREPCIIHIASADFCEAVDLAKHAEAIGADAISAIPPLFFKYGEDDVYNYYKTLAGSVNIPFIVYNYPGIQVNMSVDLITKLYEIKIHKN